MKTWLLCALALLLTTSARAAELIERSWTVNGVTRTALVHLPAKTEGAAVIFAYHGHGGTAGFAARRFRLHTLWPEAIVLYPQGLPTSTQRDPNGARAGWMMFGGSLLPNRDLTFFDALLATVQTEWKGDSKRLFVTGHSNGGGFTYYLWGQRPELFAALAPVSASGARLITNAKPCPVLAIGAKNDTIVPWDGQQAAIDAAKQHNGDKAPVEVFLHNGGHAYPNSAPEKIIAFFKRFTRK